MKLIDTQCPKCGAMLKVDSEKKQAKCEFCGASLLIDDEVQHIQYDNVEDAGYKFERGRQRAQQENSVHNNSTQSNTQTNMTPPKKKSKMIWWVLGWICIFPIPLTILMLRNKKLSKGIKISIIAVAWVVYFLIGISGSSNNTENNDKTASNISEETTDNADTTEDIVSTEETTLNSGVDSIENNNMSIIEEFVNSYNSSADNDLVFSEDFDVQDKSSFHYETEFRLSAYDDAIGKSYTLDNATIDLVLRTASLSNDTIIRLYASNATLEQCNDIISNASVLMDSQISQEDVQNTISYINENKEANGYYYGDLGIVLLGSDDKGYDLLMKMKND